MYTLYEQPTSNNCYKIRLLCKQAGIPFQSQPINLKNGDQRLPEFLQKNPNGKVPLLGLEDGTFLPESNAILFYLAEGTAFLPYDRRGRGQVLQWMFFEQYSHEPNIAVLRSWSRQGLLEQNRTLVPKKMEEGIRALGVMETHFKLHSFFVNEKYSIADIALYAYTHVAHEAGFTMEQFPHTRLWISRIEAQPNFIPSGG